MLSNFRTPKSWKELSLKISNLGSLSRLTLSTRASVVKPKGTGHSSWRHFSSSLRATSGKNTESQKCSKRNVEILKKYQKLGFKKTQKIWWTWTLRTMSARLCSGNGRNLLWTETQSSSTVKVPSIKMTKNHPKKKATSHLRNMKANCPTRRRSSPKTKKTSKSISIPPSSNSLPRSTRTQKWVSKNNFKSSKTKKQTLIRKYKT